MKKPLRKMDLTGKSCPVCKVGELIQKQGKFGPFTGCSRFPFCWFIQKNSDAGKTPEELQADAILAEAGCGHLVMK